MTEVPRIPRKYRVSVTIIDTDYQYYTDDLKSLFKDSLKYNFDVDEFKDIEVEEVD